MTEMYKICDQQDVDDSASFGFSLETPDQRIDGFLVHHDGAWFAYRNQCPHTGAPLDWVEHQFLDRDGALIQCAVHDARFMINSGECVAGPCAGDRLTPLQIELAGGQVFYVASE